MKQLTVAYCTLVVTFTGNDCGFSYENVCFIELYLNLYFLCCVICQCQLNNWLWIPPAKWPIYYIVLCGSLNSTPTYDNSTKDSHWIRWLNCGMLLSVQAMKCSNSCAVLGGYSWTHPKCVETSNV